MKRRSRELSLKQCYAALELEQGASLEDLKRAYRRRAFELHPDLNPGNPDANHEFQLTNEAYVILTKLLTATTQSPPKPEEKTTGGPAEAGQAEAEKHDAAAASPEQEKNAENAAEEPRTKQPGTRQAERTAHAAYAKEEDVLRDLLNDPFARRVFEDIYAQVRYQDIFASPPPQQQRNEKSDPAVQKADADWNGMRQTADLSQGIGKAVKGWMRSQIDDQQTFNLAPSMLIPGARIRLQIRRGIRGDELSTVEITLPKDYMAGKPVRLKGMGKHIGPWQGDLYLTLLPKA